MAKRNLFTPIITANNNVIMKSEGKYLLNQKEVGTNLTEAKTALSKLEKKQNIELKKNGCICTY